MRGILLWGRRERFLRKAAACPLAEGADGRLGLFFSSRLDPDAHGPPPQGHGKAQCLSAGPQGQRSQRSAEPPQELDPPLGQGPDGAAQGVVVDEKTARHTENSQNAGLAVVGVVEQKDQRNRGEEGEKEVLGHRERPKGPRGDGRGAGVSLYGGRASAVGSLSPQEAEEVESVVEESQRGPCRQGGQEQEGQAPLG